MIGLLAGKMKTKILIIEDDVKTANLIKLYLQQQHYTVQIAYDGREGLMLARDYQPDLIVLDLMLPHVDGLDICRILRQDTDIPMIMLTARSTEDDILIGLELGADDYITKPFSPREVVARVKTVLRRMQRDTDAHHAEITLGQLNINLTRHEVRIQDAVIRLTPKEFKLLELMARNPGRAFSRLDLVELAFGYDYEGLERTVDAHIMNLRRKIEPDHTNPTYIETVYGIGYRFTEVIL